MLGRESVFWLSFACDHRVAIAIARQSAAADARASLPPLAPRRIASSAVILSVAAIISNASEIAMLARANPVSYHAANVSHLDCRITLRKCERDGEANPHRDPLTAQYAGNPAQRSRVFGRRRISGRVVR